MGQPNSRCLAPKVHPRQRVPHQPQVPRGGSGGSSVARSPPESPREQPHGSFHAKFGSWAEPIFRRPIGGSFGELLRRRRRPYSSPPPLVSGSFLSGHEGSPPPTASGGVGDGSEGQEKPPDLLPEPPLLFFLLFSVLYATPADRTPPVHGAPWAVPGSGKYATTG